MTKLTRTTHRRGITAVIAMFFLAIATTLALAMYAATTTTTITASNMMDGERARSAAESGLRWSAWRMVQMARPKTTVGNITASVASTLWPSIRTSITNDLAAMMTATERATTWDGTTLTTSSIAVDETGVNNAAGARFVVTYRLHPLSAGDALDSRYIRVTSTGTYKNSRRVMSLDFKIDKKVKFAIVGKVPIQLGRNTIVEGPVAMASANKYPPVYMLSDFHHLNSTLGTQIDNFNTFLENNHKGYDNRISVYNSDEMAKATAAGYSDVNGDSYIDEYDLFLKYYDTNHDKAISTAEFTDPSTGKLYDPDLFKAIDSLGAPQYAGDATRSGFQDGVIDNRDGYTKVRGQISMATTANNWIANLPTGTTIQDEMQGPISATDSSELPVKFGASSTDIFDLTPSDFDTSGFLAKSGTNAGSTQTSGGAYVTIQNKTLSATDTQTMQVTNPGWTTFHAGDVVLKSDFDAANSSLSSSHKATGTNTTPSNATEQTPYGSTAYQATYSRPVFKNVHFKNVIIPKGLNALFDGCTFDGVTYVQMTTNITNTSGQTSTSASDGMTWSKRMRSGSFSASTTLTASNSYGFTDGNNLRFNNCNINGPLASDVPTAYSHFTNSWEFTGATLFNNQVDQTATMVCPQTNIEMGSFTDPSAAPSTLVGVVVTGNIDIRGSSVVDGSIIVTGDGAGNTTQGWFGPSDASTDPSSPMPEGGWGRLNIRYNPYRALPDGINVAVDILPETDSYQESQ